MERVGAVGVQFFYSFGCRGSGFAGLGVIMGQVGAVGVQSFYSCGCRGSGFAGFGLIMGHGLAARSFSGCDVTFFVAQDLGGSTVVR